MAEWREMDEASAAQGAMQGNDRLRLYVRLSSEQQAKISDWSAAGSFLRPLMKVVISFGGLRASNETKMMFVLEDYRRSGWVRGKRDKGRSYFCIVYVSNNEWLCSLLDRIVDKCERRGALT